MATWKQGLGGNLTLSVISIVFLANILLLLWIGANLLTILSVWFVQVILTFGGSALLNKYRARIADPVLFYLAAYCVGLMILYLSGFVWLHRGLLGNVPKWAAIASFAPLCVLAVIGVKQAISQRWHVASPKTAPLTVLLTVSFVVTAMATYGFDNNDNNIKINQPQWRQSENMVPVWSYQGDREFHYTRILLSTYKEGFPPKRVNHRGFHVSVLTVTLLTGNMTRRRVMSVYKSMAWVYFFMLSYGLYAIGRRLLDLGDKLSVFIGASALMFSPLKLPLLALTPTYRGFFSGSGTLYHSDTQYTSMACSAVGIYLVLVALKDKTSTFFLGCALIAGAFFLKPSNFLILAPACYLFALICWQDFNKDRLWGLAILLVVPIVWFGYIQFTGVSSNIDGVVGRPDSNSEGLVDMGFKIKFFAGYLPMLQGRFPEWIGGSPGLTIIAMTLMSFAAFWLSGFAALKKVVRQTRLRPNKILEHMHIHAHIYFCLAFFFAAILLSTVLSDSRSKNINWKWSAAAAYVFCLPLFAKGITLVKSTVLRRISWGFYGVQLAQGMGYLAYLFWYSKLI